VSLFALGAACEHDESELTDRVARPFRSRVDEAARVPPTPPKERDR
jgi:hypothetical protein